MGPRQPSSQASLQQNSLEQSRKQTIGPHLLSTTYSTRAGPETEDSINDMNEMLKHYQQNFYRKIPGGCIEQTTGMPSESARIIKVDFERTKGGY